MVGYIIETGKWFEKSYKRLPKFIKKLAKKKEAIFRFNPFDSRLNTHKLHGKDRDSWAFSVTGKYRIKFIFLADDRILFLDIGQHDIYQ